MTAELPLLRTSERGAFKRCPQRWWWGSVEGWGPTGPPDVKLWFGTQWHALMAHWYQPGMKRAKDPMAFWRSLIGEETVKIRVNLTSNDEYKEEVYIEAGKLGEIMFEHYLDTYGKDPSWRIIQTEHVGQAIIKHPTTLKPFVLYSFTYDGVYVDEETGKIWLLEHKTAKAIMTNHLALDDQAGSYWTVATAELRASGLIQPRQAISGIMYNFARKAPPDSRPKNERGVTCNKATKNDYIAALGDEFTPAEYRKMQIIDLEEYCDEQGMQVFGEESKSQPTPTLLRYPVTRTRAERNSQIQKIQNEYLVMEKYKSKELELIKNPTRDCSWDCSFYAACVLHERGSDWQEFMEGTMVQGDAYEPYRKSASDAGDM